MDTLVPAKIPERRTKRTKRATALEPAARLVELANHLEEIAGLLALRAFDYDGKKAHDFDVFLERFVLPRLREEGLPRDGCTLELLKSYFDGRNTARRADAMLSNLVGACTIILLREATACALTGAGGVVCDA